MVYGFEFHLSAAQVLWWRKVTISLVNSFFPLSIDGAFPLLYHKP